MNKVIISCFDINLKKLILWLQLAGQLATFDYVTTGRRKAHRTPDWLPGETVPWSVHPSNRHSFNRSGRISGLGKTSLYEFRNI